MSESDKDFAKRIQASRENFLAGSLERLSLPFGSVSEFQERESNESAGESERKSAGILSGD